jgi:hypothetical protein
VSLILVIPWRRRVSCSSLVGNSLASLYAPPLVRAPFVIIVVPRGGGGPSSLSLLLSPLAVVSCLVGVLAVIVTPSPSFSGPIPGLPGRGWCSPCCVRPWPLLLLLPLLLVFAAVVHVGSGVILVVHPVLVLPGVVWSRLGALGLLWRWWRWRCRCRHLRRCGSSSGGGGGSLALASPSPSCSLELLLLPPSLLLLLLRRRPLPSFSSSSSWRHRSCVSWSCPVALVVRSVSVVMEHRRRREGRGTSLGVRNT